jgi:hypothetical protein
MNKTAIAGVDLQSGGVKEVDMRQVAIIALTALFAASLAAPASAQRSRYVQNRTLVPQQAYNYCYQLALSRGLTISRGDYNRVDAFISGCLSGRIR